MNGINLTVSVFSSIVELKQKKARVISKGIYNNTFHGVVKTWKDEDLSYLNEKCYPVLSMLCYTMLFFPLHRETYIPDFHFISYLTDHQIQMLERRKCGRFPHFEFLRYYVLCLRDTCFDFQYLSFLIIWQVLKQLLRVLVTLPIQQKNPKKDTVLW